MVIMTPGMKAEGITSEEMEKVYQWGKQFEEKLQKELNKKGAK